jgi:hypothetical protein
MVTILYKDEPPYEADARAGGDALWVALPELERATGWLLKPEGVCRGDVCVPVPAGREEELVRDERLDLAAFARLLGDPVVHEGDVWVVGESARGRAAALQSLEAPDFTLPDLEGRPHSLSDYRGHKVLLVSWASW